jgi:hypothetical protein
MYNPFGLGHAELLNALRGAYRNRKRWRWSKHIHKKLLEACVGFTRNGFRIVDTMVLARLRVAFRELGIINRRVRILVEGEFKASEMQTELEKRKVFKWVPQLKAWLRDETYKFWLGTIQISSEGHVCLTTGV